MALNDADVCPPQPTLRRENSVGGIPIYNERQISVTKKPGRNFKGQVPDKNGVWYGAIEFEICGEEYALDKFLNFGAEGQTYSVVQKSTGRRMAAKFCNNTSSQEVELVQKLPAELVQHPNFMKYEMILKSISAHFPPAQHALFMDLLPNGELFDFLASAQGKPVSEGTSRRFLRDIIAGMAQCYKSGVTHRDLKPENLLINKEGRVVIIDLGHAKRCEVEMPDPSADGLAPPMPVPLEKATTANPYGTPAFNAPEVASGKKYVCELSDVWSVGVIAFYLHAKLPAFVQGQGIAYWSDISGADNTAFWHKISTSGWYRVFPEDLKQFINVFWRKDPTERPTFQQLALGLDNDSSVLSQFPGLKWITQPLNDVEAFMDELIQTNSNIVLDIEGRVHPAPAKKW